MNTSDLLQKVIIPVLVCGLLTACAPSPEAIAKQTAVPATSTAAAWTPTAQVLPTLTSQPALKLCEGDAQRTDPGYTLVEPGTMVEILWHAEFVPWWVRLSPDGRVLAVTDGGDSIYKLKPDGTLNVVFRCPGVTIETAVAATDGALWFASRDGGRLYRVAPDGTVKIMAQNGNRNLETGPDGSVYAMENSLVRINPDGTIKVITNAVYGRKFAIGPNGEIVALLDGNIVRISDSGEITQIASGYGPEPWLTFGPDGLLYVTHWTGVDVIDLATNSISSIAWLKYSNIGESSTFAPDGRLLLYHPNTDVYAIDLSAKALSVYYQVISNSWAMAVNPGDAVYIAFGNNLANGETIIYRLSDEQKLEPVARVPFGMERSMAFDSQGKGYLGVMDRNIGSAIFQFDPASGEVFQYYQAQCAPDALTLNPQTGRVWWNECDNFISLDENQNRVVIQAVPGGQGVSLAITPQGEFFSIVFFPRANPDLPYEHRLYHWNLTDRTWEQVADLTQSDPAITISTLVACPDGKIYTVESLDGSHLPAERAKFGSSFNAVRQLEPDNTLTLLGYDFSFDGLSADCDPATGRIIFTSGAGIFSLTQP